MQLVAKNLNTNWACLLDNTADCSPSQCSESTGDVLVGQGGVDHPRSKGGGGEEGGGNEDGGGDEKGEESPMDGLIGWTRLGKKRRVS